MKYVLVLLIILVSFTGCSSIVGSQTIFLAENFCYTRGGIHVIEVSGFELFKTWQQDVVLCKNGESIHVGEIDDKK